MSDKKTETRSDYFAFNSISTRWSDNDVYGHVNNVVYYSYFDTAANNYLINEGGLDIENSPIIGFVVNSGCNYNSSIAYPDKIEAGLRVDRLGNSSVQYGVAIFKESEEQAAANGHFVHVFVDRETNKPVAIPDKMRAALEAILVK
ncbi:MAG: thioesterase family protein [Bermanella sp.]